MQPSSPFPSRRPASRAKLMIVIVVVLMVLVALLTLAVLALFAVPVAHPFSGTVSTSYCSSCGSPYYVGSVMQAFPTEVSVTLNWQSNSSSGVSFTVFPSSSTADVCDQSGASGVCSFTASAATYTIFVEDLEESQGVLMISYSGSYSAPYI